MFKKLLMSHWGSPCASHGQNKIDTLLLWLLFFIVGHIIFVYIIRRSKSSNRLALQDIFRSRVYNNEKKKLRMFQYVQPIIKWWERPLLSNIIVILHFLCVSNRWCDSSTSAEIDMLTWILHERFYTIIYNV